MLLFFNLFFKRFIFLIYLNFLFLVEHHIVFYNQKYKKKLKFLLSKYQMNIFNELLKSGQNKMTDMITSNLGLNGYNNNNNNKNAK